MVQTFLNATPRFGVRLPRDIFALFDFFPHTVQIFDQFACKSGQQTDTCYVPILFATTLSNVQANADSKCCS